MSDSSRKHKLRDISHQDFFHLNNHTLGPVMIRSQVHPIRNMSQTHVMLNTDTCQA